MQVLYRELVEPMERAHNQSVNTESTSIWYFSSLSDANSIAEFFEQATQMAIPHDTVTGLRDQEIDNREDLSEFDKVSLNRMMELPSQTRRKNS